jgi:hypothetical protein
VVVQKLKFLNNHSFKLKGAMNMKKTISAVLVILAVLLLYGCSVLFQPPEQEQAAPGKGRVVVTIEGGASSARTFLPVLPDLSQAVYALNFSSSDPEQEDVFMPITGTTTDVELVGGEWTLQVDVYLAITDIGDLSKVVSSGTATVTVSPGGTTSVPVSLAPVQSGRGTLRYTITLPTGGAATASLTIEKVSGEAAPPVVKDLLEDSESYAGSVSLPAGKHRLTVKLSDGAGKYARWVGIAHIYQPLETLVSCVFGDDPFSESFFTDVSALSSWLSAADENTAAAPYPIYLALDDFASLAGTGGGLSGVLDALHGRYVALDLSEGAADAIPDADGAYAAHADADKLTAVTLPSGLETIGDYGLAGLSGIASLDLPVGLTAIGDYAFQDCSDLQAVNIPQSTPPSLGSGAFDGTSGLILVPAGTDATYKSATNWSTYAASIFGPDYPIFFSLDDMQSYFASASGGSDKNDPIMAGLKINLADLETSNDALRKLFDALPGGTKYVGVDLSLSTGGLGTTGWQHGSRPNKENLAAITLPSTVTVTPAAIFSDSTSLVTADLSRCALTVIQQDLFNGCSSLSSILLPEGLTTIGHQAFQSCSSLSSITLPKSLATLGYYAFQSCSSLSSVTFSEGMTALTKIDSNTFRDCSSLSSITLPEGLTEIAGSAFRGCAALSSVTLPASLTTIGATAFRDCSALSSMTVQATTPPSLDSNVFQGAWAGSYAIYVPAAAVSTYQAATGWNGFSSNIQAIP